MSLISLFLHSVGDVRRPCLEGQCRKTGECENVINISKQHFDCLAV
ncbi:hypothetical protein DDI_1271 [Dickeya dianthicola RNS04.9]|nr:hypothetical protein DDI_1271 [Dickeya dianthicola RNS04.9]